MTQLTATAVLAAASKGGVVLAGTYELSDGTRFVGLPISDIPAALRGVGWENVSRIDRFDLRNLGVEVREAHVIRRDKRTTRVIDVVVIR